MGNERDQIMNLVNQQTAQLLRQENSLVRQVIQGYENARRDLLASFTDRFNSLGENPDPAVIRQLATDMNMIRAIEARLAQLQQETEGLLSEGLQSVGGAGWSAAMQEVGVLARGLGINLMRFAVDPNLELTIGAAVGQVTGWASTLQSRITATLRESLASGDRFSTIVRQVFGQNGGIWPNGRTSAELMVRRAVIQAYNNARMLFYEQSQQYVPGLQKQAVAAISGRTTETCLMVHGQIKPLNEPFQLEGKEAFSGRLMQPPFHWHCRTVVVGYHPIFEDSSGMKTSDMLRQAQMELADR